jgi:hypothetical protein
MKSLPLFAVFLIERAVGNDLIEALVAYGPFAVGRLKVRWLL